MGNPISNAIALGKAVLVCSIAAACGSRMADLRQDAGTGTESSAPVGGIDATGGSASFDNTASGGYVSANTALTNPAMPAGGAAPTQTTAVASSATLGVPRKKTDPYPCTSATTAYYDQPPITDPTAGCRDIYVSGLYYPFGTKYTMVAPTAPNAASCEAWDCACENSGCWGPRNTTYCGIELCP